MEDQKDKSTEGQASKGNPLLTRRDVLKIGGATVATAALTQLVISGPFSSDAVQGIGRDTHSNGHGSSESVRIPMAHGDRSFPVHRMRLLCQGLPGNKRCAR